MGTPVRAVRGMVATSQRLASEVGVALLERGGSAVDAAIGANAMLSLIEPYMCGPGGDLFAIVWDPQARRLEGLNASGRAPFGQTLDALRVRLGGAATIPVSGPTSVTVPGAVRGWQALHERWGRLPLGEIFAPVIEHAAAGVDIGPNTAVWWDECARDVTGNRGLGTLADAFRATFMRDGRAPLSGEQFANPCLADFYAALARDGFADFYEGTLASRLADFLERKGSAIRAPDLARATADWVAPISTAYRGVEVHELPPNGQGLAVLQMLNVLEQFPLGDHGPDSADYRHWLIEAKKLAFEDRARYYADPAFVDVPVAALNDKRYAAERAALVGDRASAAPVPGDPALSRGDTTYLSVADAEGLMVSLIQSIFVGFGSGLVPDGTGYPLQSRGAAFALDPTHPNVYAPGKRPFHTIIPAFVTCDGAPLMSLGVMGADMQPQGQVQVLVNMIDFGMDPQAAGDAARLRHDGLNAPNRPQRSDGGIVWHEPEVDGACVAELRRRGHDVRVCTEPVLHFMGGYECVRREADGYTGASEPRFDGCALGL